MILITGGEGALGSAIRSLLADTELHVKALGRGELDVTDAEQVLWAFNKYQPDVVVNCAAMTNVNQCEHKAGDALLVNGVAAGLVASAAEAQGAQLIHISTDYVFRGDAGPYADDAIPYPINHYGVSKYFGEQAVQRLHTNFLIIRIGWLYGPEYPTSMPQLAKAATTTTVNAWTDIKGTPTLLRDAANRIANEAAGRDIVGTIHSSTSRIVHLGPWMEPVSWYDFLVKDHPQIRAARSPFGDTKRPKQGGLIPSEGWTVG